MAKVVVDLHSHEQSGSHDSLTPATQMRSRFADVVDAPVFIGFVGHDQLPTGTDAFAVGVEHTTSESSPEVHIVEYPEYDFRFLAHPQRIDPDNTKQTAKAYINEFGLDGVEKYRSGYKQYNGSIGGVVELSGSDAHNPHGYPTSHMVVDVERVGAGPVFDEIKSGRAELVSVGKPPLWHKLGKAVSMLWAGTV